MKGVSKETTSQCTANRRNGKFLPNLIPVQFCRQTCKPGGKNHGQEVKAIEVIALSLCIVFVHEETSELGAERDISITSLHEDWDNSQNGDDETQ